VARGTEDAWTIEDLGEAVAAALASDYVGQASGRIREVPDRRTIRYYTTLGLIDRPALRGRTALYGRRHLLQLVAIKRLQAEGSSLAEVQGALQGVPLSTLERIARLPEGEAPRADVTPHAGAAGKTGRRAGAFWQESPAEDREAPRGRVEAQPRATLSVGAREEAGKRPRTLEEGELAGIRVRTDVALLFPPARALDREDAEALGEALEPVVRLLIRRGLMKPSADRER
jgi:DNA-binding transcriptional MerR regulator